MLKNVTSSFNMSNIASNMLELLFSKVQTKFKNHTEISAMFISYAS